MPGFPSNYRATNSYYFQTSNEANADQVKVYKELCHKEERRVSGESQCWVAVAGPVRVGYPSSPPAQGMSDVTWWGEQGTAGLESSMIQRVWGALRNRAL